MGMGIVFLALGFLRIEKGTALKPTELAIEKKGYQLDRR